MRGFKVVVVLWAVMAWPCVGAELELKVVDNVNAPIPCRVLLLDSDGKSVVPEGFTAFRSGPHRWFVIDGHDAFEAPQGRYTLRVERGLEYTRYKKRLRIDRESVKLQVELSRWADMRSRGYTSGENHSHVPYTRLAPLLAAEALDFGSSLLWWNDIREGMPVPRGPAHQRPMSFASHTAPSRVFDAEIEHPWGAVYITNLPEPLSIPSERGRPYLDFLKHAVDQGAVVHYQAGWAREVALDALLGYVHVVNVCNNNFHMHQYQPRSRYSNLLEVPGFEVFEGTEEGMLRMNTATYYRMLNWGLRLAAGAGSACGVKDSPLGYNRAYVRAGGDPTLDDFYENWKAGRNFVTNGPMLFLQTDQGQKPGDTIAFDQPGRRVKLSLQAYSRVPLTSVQIVVNGRVVHDFEIDDKNIFRGEAAVVIRDGSWITARCTARDGWLSDKELSVFTRGAIDAPFPTRPSRIRFAHTSPIYVTVGGRDAAVVPSIQEGLRMLDGFESFTRANADPKYQADTLEAVDRARLVLQNRLITTP
ncbi:MAG: CehA/McbA family metallohydrolase [Planctomycetota bacterium]|jgi:hypothetical protein